MPDLLLLPVWLEDMMCYSKSPEKPDTRACCQEGGVKEAHHSPGNKDLRAPDKVVPQVWNSLKPSKAANEVHSWGTIGLYRAVQ